MWNLPGSSERESEQRTPNQMKNLKPLSDRIIVETVSAEEKSAGGILLPDAAQEKPQRGKVIATGPGRVLDTGKIAPMDVKVGDEVYYSKYGGTEIKVDGEEIVVLSQSDVIGIVTG